MMGLMRTLAMNESHLPPIVHFHKDKNKVEVLLVGAQEKIQQALGKYGTKGQTRLNIAAAQKTDLGYTRRGSSPNLNHEDFLKTFLLHFFSPKTF